MLKLLQRRGNHLLHRATRQFCQLSQPSQPLRIPNPVVFVQGEWLDKWVWERYFLPRFQREGFSTVTLSFGIENQTMAENTQDLKNVIQGLKSDVPPVIIAHGMGALVALEYLRREAAPPPPLSTIRPSERPPEGVNLDQRKNPKAVVNVNDRAASLILINPYTIPITTNPIPPVRQKLLIKHLTFFWPLLFGGGIRMINKYMAAVSYFQKMTKEEVEENYQFLQTEPPNLLPLAYLQPAFEAGNTFNVRDVMIIGGEEDQLVTPEEIYTTAAFLGLQPYQVHMLPDAAHNFLLDEERSNMCMDHIIKHLVKIQGILDKVAVDRY